MNYSGILDTEKISRIYQQKVCSVPNWNDSYMLQDDFADWIMHIPIWNDSYISTGWFADWSIITYQIEMIATYCKIILQSELCKFPFEMIAL